MLPTQAVRPLADQIAILNAARRALLEAHDMIARAMEAPTVIPEQPERMGDGGKVANAIAIAHRGATEAACMLARIVQPLAPAVDAAIGGAS